MSKRTAIVLGPTGLIGKYLLDQLIKDEQYEKVKIFHRRKVQKVHEKIEQFVIDMDKLEEQKENFNGDDVFCCLGTTMKKAGSKEAFKKVDHDYPVKAAALAEENNIRNFIIITAIGADRSSAFFYNKVKGEVEDDIISKKIPSIHILRPSILDGERNETRIGEKIGLFLMRSISFLFVGKLKKYRPIHGKTIAKAMITVAKNETKGLMIYESDVIKHIKKGQ